MADTDQFSSEALGDDQIDVTPTRALFVEMLTRDILLSRAVIDLVDNSVDGARRLRPEANQELSGLEIKIVLDREHFSIADNCGGIGIDIARHYAFRFGRAKGMKSTPNSVGQFGVGMKRALFKFGHKFEVLSTTRIDRFELRVDVDFWEQEQGPWRFTFEKVETNLQLPESETGTTIIVRPLRSNTASQFGDRQFQNALAREIQAAQQQYIDRGLRIVFNGKGLIATPWKLTQGAGIEPMHAEDEIRLPSGGLISRRIYVGVSESSPQAAGWYVFCNGRMILEADQSEVTGWETAADQEGVTVPKFHGQFARFRGYLFLDSTDASLLPWNTTKTGVEADSEVWRNTYLMMRNSMRPVIDFLNRLDREIDLPENERSLTRSMKSAATKPIRTLPNRPTFAWPQTVVAQRRPGMTSIQISRPKEQVEALCKALDARSNVHLGELLFDTAFQDYVSK